MPVSFGTRSKTSLSSEVLDFVADTISKPGTGDAFLEEARQQIRGKCQTDLWFLCFRVLGYKDIDNDLHHEMCTMWGRRAHRRVTLWLVPRGHLKTTLWTIGDAIQVKLNDPNHRHLIINAKLDNAEAILGEIKAQFETNALLRWLFPEYCWDKLKGTAKKRFERLGKVTVSRLDFPCRTVWRKEGNIEIMSVGASLVSKHFDRMTFDDMTNDKFVDNANIRDSNFSWYRNALQLRDNPSTPIRIIGTRWHFDDPYGRLDRNEKSFRKKTLLTGKKKARMLCYIRRATEEDPSTGLPASIWPERFTLDDLDEIKHDIGSYIYSCQYENNPLPDESAIFKRDQIKSCYPWDIPKNVSYFIGVDLADEDTKKGDFSAVVVIAVDQFGRTYTKEVIKGKIFPLQLIDTLIELCEQYNPERVAVETTAFQKSIYKYWQKVARERNVFIPWKEVKRSTAKFRRILMLQPLVERGDFYIVEGCMCADDLILEMVEFSGRDSAYDDCLDALQAAYECSSEAPEPAERERPLDCAGAIFDSLFGAFEEEDSDDWEPALVGNEWAA